jgi:cytochrome P450
VEIGGYGFPAGTRFIVSPYTLHRRPELFADPERFDPDRFAPEAEDRLPKGAYLPFVNGPRNCIGHGFALMEGQIVLATLAQRVAFSLAPGQRIARGADYPAPARWDQDACRTAAALAGLGQPRSNPGILRW